MVSCYPTIAVVAILEAVQSMSRIPARIPLLILTCGVFLMSCPPPHDVYGAPVRPLRSKEENKGDKMFPDGTHHDFGKVPCGTLAKHSFRIVNNSEFPLRILGVNASMSPARGHSTQGVLEPGEEARIETVVDTNRFVGSRIMTLYLLMDQGGIPKEVRLWIQADSQK
jgi:uncharacterized protein DUF1573